MRFMWMVLLVLLLPGAAAAASDRPLPADQSYGVYRDGTRIGSRTTRFRREGDDLIVEIASDIEVTIVFITVYSLSERQTEVWRDGTLMAFTSTVDENGSKSKLEMVRGDNGLEVVGKRRRRPIPPDAVPETFWNPLTATATTLIDIDKGKALTVEVKAEGQETIPVHGDDILTTKYRITGDRDRLLWYDAEGVMIRMQLTASDGSTIEVRPSAGD